VDIRETPLQAYRLSDDAEVELDGQLDEEFWDRAVAVSDFTQQEPVEGGIPSERTEVRVVYDDDAFYIGAIIYDDPEGILAFQRQRDAGLGTDDRFMWILDTFHDGRTGYFFEINAAGLMGDGILGGGGGGPGGPGGGGGGGVNKSWDGIWEARTTIRPDGWSAEIEIPFRTVNFDPRQDTWGINFQRTVRRRQEEILWRGWRRNEGLFSPVHAGDVTGLQGMSQGLGLEAVPSAIQSWRRTPGRGAGDSQLGDNFFPGDVSLDLNYSITSSLRASVSVNTDFAEVEADQRQVNLTRFPLFFPERRDFFLEGSGVFSFAPRSGANPFFSRRIGLNQGSQIPIDFGGRMTGQAGSYELGFYQIRAASALVSPLDPADPQVEVPTEDFTVARVKRRIFEQSSIGTVYTRRAAGEEADGTAPPDRHTAGVDMELATRYFLGDNNAELSAFFVWNSNPERGVDRSLGDLTGRGFRLNFPNDIWSGHVSYREFGEYYDPAVGFVTRNDFRRVEPRIGWSPRPESVAWLRRLNFDVQFRYLTELGTGILEEREWSFGVLGLDFESGDFLNFSVQNTYEFLNRPFEIVDGIDIGTGSYDTWSYQIRAGTTGRRQVSLFTFVNLGEFWNGDRIGFNTRVTFRPRPGLSLSTNVEHNDVRLPQGDFSTNVYALDAEWTPTPWVSTTSQLQYDDQSKLVGLFTRLRWIVAPGNEIFLVYTHNWQNVGAGLLDDRNLRTLSQGGSVKASYTYRF
ncbi:MAG: DUF5916 domain-containing protein, partial [Gemmatimonadota bacterium]